MEDPQLRQAAIDKARIGGGDKGLGVWHARGCALITQVILMPRSTVHSAQCAVHDKKATGNKGNSSRGWIFHNEKERPQSIINAKHAKQNKKRCLPQAKVQQGIKGWTFLSPLLLLCLFP